MSKFLLLIFVVLAVWWLARTVRRKHAARDTRDAAPEQMVTCGHCGLHLPQGEAIPAGDRFFCCEEHRRQAG